MDSITKYSKLFLFYEKNRLIAVFLCLLKYKYLTSLFSGVFLCLEIDLPSYSVASKKRLESCHADIQTIFEEVIKTVDHSIFCGHRNRQSQTKAFESKLSKTQYPNSRHNSTPSMAIDAGPYFTELKNTDWNDHKAFAFFAGYVKCTAVRLLNEGKIKHSIRWGGDWDSDGRTLDQTFNDLPHFELVRVK